MPAPRVSPACLAAALLLAGPVAAQQLRYEPFTADQWVGAGPRLAVEALPLDDRIAPDDFALDDIVEPLPDAATQRALTERALPGVAQDYTPSPALWRIGDRDTTIWIFGTVHVLPPGFRWRSPALERVVAGADRLIVESLEDGTGRDDLFGLADRGDARLRPLSQRVSPSHRAKLAQLVATLPPEAAKLLDGLPTWIAAVAVGIVREVRAGELPGPGADDWIEARFRAAGKPVEAIEDGASVYAKVAAIPEAEQRRMLDAALDAPTPTRAELRAPIHAWAKGDVGPGSPIVVDTGSAALSTALLDDRNKAWADTLARRLATPGKMLFAAGAGHFIGPGSVLTLLERRGVKVVREQ